MTHALRVVSNHIGNEYFEYNIGWFLFHSPLRLKQKLSIEINCLVQLQFYLKGGKVNVMKGKLVCR